MTAPSFISVTATVFNTSSTPKTTANIAVQNGDVLVATLMSGSSASTPGISTSSGSTSAWILQEGNQYSSSSENGCATWTATATATGSIAVNFTCTSSATFGGLVKVWRNSSGIGNVARNGNATGSGLPTCSLVTIGNNSGLDFSSADWNGTTGTYTYTSTNGAPVSDENIVDSGNGDTYHSAHVVDAGVAGSQTFGMSSPSGQRYACTLIEVLGIASSTPPIGAIIESLQAVKRAAYW